MEKPYVCVAGIRSDGLHVRPVLESGRLGRDLLCSRGGPFALGAVVDLGSARPRPVVPEVEDVVCSLSRVRSEQMLKGVTFGNLLKRSAKASLSEIFGDDLLRMSRTATAVPKGAGIASLGVLQVRGRVSLFSTLSFEKPQIRCTFADQGLGELSLKVTDLRLWEVDHKTPVLSRLKALESRLSDCLVAVGLGRAYRVPAYPGSWHWLQINNIYPLEDPLWARE